MTQVKEWSNQQINRALAELMGYTVEIGPVTGLWRLIKDGKIKATSGGTEELMWSYTPDYCADPVASLEIEAAAIALSDQYVDKLVKVKQPKNMAYSRACVAELLTATPRERAEAAYITLQGAKGNG